VANGCGSMRRFVLPALVCLSLGEMRAEAQVVPGPAIGIPSGRRVGPALFVVDDTASACRFSSQIQPAVNAATDGDVILVKRGRYPKFVVDGKSVCIFGEAGATGTAVQVDDGLVVKNLRADQFVVLRGLVVGQTATADTFTNNAGPIWVEDCRFSTRSFSVSSSSGVGMFNARLTTSVTGTGLTVSGSNLFAYRSSFTGAPGENGNASDYCDGIYYYYYGCIYCGGIGINGCLGGEDGRPALSLSSAGHAFLFGGETAGGAGGNGITVQCCSAPPGVAGPAMSLASGTSVVSMDATLTGGITGPGASTTLPGPVGGYSISSPVASGSSAVLKFTGPAGWNVFLAYDFDYAPAFVPSGSGYSVVDPASTTLFIGALPSSGSLQVSMPFSLPPSVRASVFYGQAVIADPVTGTPYLAEPSALLVVRDPCP